MAVLEAKNLSLGYREKQVIKQLNLDIHKGKILSLLGPNGSGKSTILKALSRNIKPGSGAVYLNGVDIHSMKTKAVARELAILTQSPEAPGDITVRDLVEYGRFPYQSWLGGKNTEDDEIVDWALEQANMGELASRLVSTLSGGERQRAWIALALAQKPDILLLDEPTTFLDISHQLEIMELVTTLNREHGITVVMVLHDINHAARYSDLVAILKDGTLFDMGTPEEAITSRNMREVFGVEAVIQADPVTGKPVFLVRGLADRD